MRSRTDVVGRIADMAHAAHAEMPWATMHGIRNVLMLSIAWHRRPDRARDGDRFGTGLALPCALPGEVEDHAWDDSFPFAGLELPQRLDGQRPDPLGQGRGGRAGMEDDATHEALAKRVSKVREVAHDALPYAMACLHLEPNDATVTGLEQQVDLGTAVLAVVVQRRVRPAPLESSSS